MNKKFEDIAKNFGVLFVEDDKFLSKMYEKIFRPYFRTIFTAENGELGIETYVANKENIDLIITDIHMPKMDGLAMAKEIKIINPDSNIMVLSAFDDPTNLHMAIDIGVDGFLTKPINLKKDIFAIEKILNRIDNKRELEKLRLRERMSDFERVGQLKINTLLSSIPLCSVATDECYFYISSNKEFDLIVQDLVGVEEFFDFKERKATLLEILKYKKDDCDDEDLVCKMLNDTPLLPEEFELVSPDVVETDTFMFKRKKLGSFGRDNQECYIITFCFVKNV